MSNVEDEYFAQIERILGIETPKPGENRVVMLNVPKWTSRNEAEQLLSLTRSRKEKMAELSVEVGEAERRYLRPIFGNQGKATQCRAVLMTLSQINTALANQEMTLVEWLRSSQRKPARRACKHCGAHVATSARFCSQCGSDLRSADQESSLTPTPTEPSTGSLGSVRKVKLPEPGQSARQIVLNAAPDSEGPMYTGSGTWLVSSGSVNLTLLSAHASSHGYSLSGKINPKSGSVTLDLVSLDPQTPNYCIEGEVDKETGAVYLFVIPEDYEASSYRVAGTVDLASGTITLNTIHHDRGTPGFSITGTL